VLGLLVVFFGGRRFVKVVGYPISSGDTAYSPDGRYKASVTDWYDESFFGHSRRGCEFEVRGGSRQRLVTDPIPGISDFYFTLRFTNSVINWAENSSAVTFVFPSVEIRMKP
jgi:hypothetical protein